MMKMFPRLLSVLILNDLYKHTQCLLSIEYGQLIQTVSILFNIQRIAPLHAHCCNTYVFFTNKHFKVATLPLCHSAMQFIGNECLCLERIRPRFLGRSKCLRELHKCIEKLTTMGSTDTSFIIIQI